MQKSSESLFEFVKRRLSESRGDWPTISRGSGVPYDTLTKIALGRVTDPRIGTVQALADYFQTKAAA